MFQHSKSDRLRHFASDVITNTRDWASTGQDLARTGSHRVRKYIDKNPMVSTLAGLGIGYLLGKLFSKRKAAPMVSAPAKREKRALSRRS